MGSSDPLSYLSVCGGNWILEGMSGYCHDSSFMMQEIVFYQLQEGTLMSFKNKLLTVKKFMLKKKRGKNCLIRKRLFQIYLINLQLVLHVFRDLGFLDLISF